MVGHQTEGDWASSLLKADFWGRDGNTFLFVIPPEGESTEIQSQLHWNGMCRTCCSWHKLCALWEEGENQAQRGAMCFIVHQNLSFFKDLSPEKPKNLDKVNLTKRVSKKPQHQHWIDSQEMGSQRAWPPGGKGRRKGSIRSNSWSCCWS